MTRDPVELEVFKNLYHSIAEEMGAALRRTAFSPNIKERRDYSCAVFDGAGQVIAMGDHMPVHLGAMPLSVRHAIDAYRLGPGDVVIVNDPFQGGTHLPDITAVSGIFLGKEKRPSFYVANRAHHADVGGMSPGSMPLAREIYQEGLRIPPVLIRRGGKMDRDLLALVLANVRTRIREIGIRKAIGATSREIRLQFLTEAVLISLAGGIVGTILGLALPFSVRFLTQWRIPISGLSAIIAITVATIVGVVFGTVPATRAAQLDPVEALHYE